MLGGQRWLKRSVLRAKPGTPLLVCPILVGSLLSAPNFLVSGLFGLQSSSAVPCSEFHLHNSTLMSPLCNRISVCVPVNPHRRRPTGPPQCEDCRVAT